MPARNPQMDPAPEPAGDEALVPYVPALAAEWLAEDRTTRHRRISGSMAFVDISGFTSLTERLTRMGKVGSEELSDILDSTFTALLEQARREDADLVKWGGDAVLLLFRGQDHAARAVRATAAMRRALYSVGRTGSSAGKVTLRMSTGIHSGDFDFFLVGDPNVHLELIVSGPAASRTAELEGAATAGQIAVSPETAAGLPRSAVEQNDDGLLLVRRAPARSARNATPVSPRPAARTAPGIAVLLPPPVRTHLLAAAGEAEHRTIAVAFIQFSGTDDLIEREGPEALATALDEVVRNVQSACESEGVTFLESDINRDGGKIMLAAGAPRGGEDLERRMLAATRRVVDCAGRLPLRVGVNRGRVFASDFGPSFRRTYSIKGDAINVAARVMGKSSPGQVLAVRDVVSRAGGGIVATEVPPFLVKGKSHPIQAALVTATGDHLRTLASGTVGLHGRNHEIGVLAAALGDARHGHGGWVELVADAGLGKSSLIAWLCDSAPDFTVLRGTSGRFGGASSHQATRRLVRDVIGASPAASPEEHEAALMKAIRLHAPDLEAWTPLLAAVLGFTLPETPELRDLDERFRPARLSQVVVSLIRSAHKGPTLFLFEGADRMDESSADVIRELLREVPDQPWLVLTGRRPDPGGLESTEEDAATRIELAPLDEAASVSFLEAITADRPVSAHLLRRVAAKAAGNPLFLRALIDTVGASSDEDLPDTIDSLIGGQIDRLAPRCRTLLRFAAVLGERFDVEDLQEMVASQGWSIDDADIRDLRGFIEPDGPVQSWFRFHNPLIRDVAYAGLPYRLRRSMHLRVGEVLERTEDREAVSERLATHFFEAGDYTRAWSYSRIAGDRARHSLSYPEAMALYDKALAASRNVRDVATEEQAQVLEAKGDVADLAGLSREAIDAYRRAKTLLRQDPLAVASLTVKETRIHQRLGAFGTASRIASNARARLQSLDGPLAAAERSRLASRLAVVHHLRSRHDDALRWSRVAVEEARESNDSSALALAYNYRELISTAAGEQPDEPYGELSLAAYTAAGDLLGQGHSLTTLAIRSLADGDWDTADARFDEATELFRRVGDAANEANSLYNRSDVLQRQARYDEAAPLLAAARRGALVTDDPELVALVDRELGKVRLGQGRIDDARELLEQARSALERLGLEHEAVDAAVSLAHCRLVEHDFTGALAEAAALLPKAQAAAVDDLEARLHLIRGAALAFTGDWEAAETAFEMGRDVTTRHDGGHVRALNLMGLALVSPRTGHDRTAELTEAQECLAQLGVVRLPPPFDTTDLAATDLSGQIGQAARG
ncbi:adenylate/guanylate cyclase domain-containing protein [Intrasporangium sp.]|uniref:adenylate/guanylate cyclase domain-containing protein n=1 Tax=Intrasporangium sp. TaxID=1925024 RepID=UPI0033654FD3